MASVTYHVVVAFDRNKDGELEPGEVMEALIIEAARGEDNRGCVAFHT